MKTLLRTALVAAVASTGCGWIAGIDPFRAELPSNDLDEAGIDGGGGPTTVDGDASDAEARASVVPEGPFCVDSTTTLFVHAGLGDDGSGDGSCLRPFKTITHAVDVLRKADRTRWTVRLGGTAAAPITYSSATGETFPLVLGSIGWILQGQSRDGVIVQGTGAATTGSGATIEIGGRSNELRDLTVESPMGCGVKVSAGANAAALDDVAVRDCKADGLEVHGTMNITLSSITDNGQGITFGVSGGASLTISDSEVSKNKGAGVFQWGDTYYESKRCRYVRNGGDGLVTIHNAGLSSTDDLVSDNGGHGFSLGSADVFAANASILRAQITLNGRDGVWIDQSPKGPNRVRDSVITGNVGAAVGLANRTLVGVDLGTLASPGNNTFASAATPNKCGVVNNGPSDIPAVGNRWSACPTASAAASCVGGTDVVRMGTGGVDSSACK